MYISWLVLLVLLVLTKTIDAQVVVVYGVSVNITQRAQATDFVVSSSLGSSKISLSNAFLAIGLNTIQDMDGADVVVCTTSKGSVEHYYNHNSISTYMDKTHPMLGLSNTSVSVVDGSLLCSFTRNISDSNTNYYDLSKPSELFVIVAYGSG